MHRFGHVALIIVIIALFYRCVLNGYCHVHSWDLGSIPNHSWNFVVVLGRGDDIVIIACFSTILGKLEGMADLQPFC